MKAYLTQRSKSDLFSEFEFHDVCRRLSDMVGHQDVTPLLAKLYAELLIDAKEGITDDKLPDNIPDLIPEFCTQLGFNEQRLRFFQLN
jgi:HEAT repeat protein